MTPPERYRLNSSSFAHYWNNGTGASLLGKLGRTPDLEQAKYKIPLLFEVDHPADEVVQALHIPLGFGQGQAVVESYIQNPGQVAAVQKEILDRFFASFEPEPGWLDWPLLNKGLEISQRSGISGLIVLRDYCLMGGYESAAINKPLIYTGALKKGAVKRISETVEFWVDITGHEALRYGHIGFTAAIKTRMIHSFARLGILRHTEWDSQKWGMPLNRWDMLATNLGFSVVYLNGLVQMGISPLEDEIRGLFHLWKYLGYLLGIPAGLLPDTEEEAIESLYYWTMTQADGDRDSKALALALQEEPVKAYYPTSRAGRLFMREIHLFYNRYLLGDYSCDLLKLDKTRIGNLARFTIWKNRWQNRNVGNEAARRRLISSGRARHEEVKAIYLKWNKRD